MNGTVNLFHKNKRRRKTDGPGNHKKSETQDKSVPEIQEGSNEAFNVQSGIVIDSVQKHVEGRRSTGEEGSPPPLPVLGG
jgi:hypothetical protein